MGLRLPAHWFGGIPGYGQWISWTIFILLAIAGATPVARTLLGSIGFALDRIGRRKAIAVAIVGVAALGVQVLIGVINGIPEPAVHDEFSYLLAADTFAHGRLTNPSPPLADAFASMHILVHPTYQSKYPPGQGMMMALGEVLMGQEAGPILGVWLGIAATCAGFTWMLLAWLPPRWAIAAGLLAAIHPELIIWGQSYWGGALAMLGGTLVLGGYGHLRAGESASHLANAAVMGLGAGILANTRPFEGLLLCVVVGLPLVVWAMRQGIGPAAKTLWPGVVILACVAAWMGYYNWRVTGHALETPYSLHERQYGITPHWILGRLRPSPTYPNPVLREFHEKWEPAQWRMQQNMGGWAREAGSKLIAMAALLCEPAALAVVVLALAGTWRRQKWARIMMGACAVVALAELGVTWYLWPHYLAPVAGAWGAMAAAGLARISGMRWGKWALWMVALTAVFASIDAARLAKARQSGFGEFRARAQALFENNPGKQLLIVQYVAGHNGHDEWVYNTADLESQKIVWAHDMGPDGNRELARAFKGRTAWLLRIAQGPVSAPEPVNP